MVQDTDIELNNASIGSHVCVYRCKKVVRTVYGKSNCFEVKVSMQQD